MDVGESTTLLIIEALILSLGRISACSQEVGTQLAVVVIFPNAVETVVILGMKSPLI
jgi:hypothetical protein